MKRYNHLYTIAFSVVSNDPDANDVTADMLRAGLESRIRLLEREPEPNWEWFNACNNEADSYEME